VDVSLWKRPWTVGGEEVDDMLTDDVAVEKNRDLA
jgi:hypothetical protein